MFRTRQAKGELHRARVQVSLRGVPNPSSSGGTPQGTRPDVASVAFRIRQAKAELHRARVQVSPPQLQPSPAEPSPASECVAEPFSRKRSQAFAKRSQSVFLTISALRVSAFGFVAPIRFFKASRPVQHFNSCGVSF